MINYCRVCKHIRKTNNGFIDYVCDKIGDMSLEEYEDYFVDNVKPCPYFKKEENKSGDA